MEQRFVEQFFEDGSLMLSSFERFAKHKDEHRNDAAEGTGVRFLTGSDFTTVSVTGRGFDCYVLCGSTVNTKAVRKCFRDADGCLVIDNPLAFANAVSTYIPGFRGGYAGHCIYQDEPYIDRHNPDLSMSDVLPKTFDDLHNLMLMSGGAEELFVKHARYAAQAEYRMLWTSALPMQDFIIVKCPEARQFCRPV